MPRKLVAYFHILAKSIRGLDTRISELVADGYEPVGLFVQIPTTTFSQESGFAQAMAKYEEAPVTEPIILGQRSIRV